MSDNEIKAKFFAMYLGQKVYCNTEITDSVHILIHEFLKVDIYLNCAHLQLRSIADLTDGEYVQVGRLVMNYPDKCTDIEMLKVGKGYIKEMNQLKGNLSFEVADYLRSIGILLPYTYLNNQNEPITLPPEQIIEKGWAKYKEK